MLNFPKSLQKKKTETHVFIRIRGAFIIVTGKDWPPALLTVPHVDPQGGEPGLQGGKPEHFVSPVFVSARFCCVRPGSSPPVFLLSRRSFPTRCCFARFFVAPLFRPLLFRLFFVSPGLGSRLTRLRKLKYVVPESRITIRVSRLEFPS